MHPVCLQKATLERDSNIASRHELEVAMQRANVEYSHSIDEQRQRYIELEAELQSLRIALEDRQAVDEHAATLALELEKERGRLAGLSTDSYSVSPCNTFIMGFGFKFHLSFTQLLELQL